MTCTFAKIRFIAKELHKRPQHCLSLDLSVDLQNCIFTSPDAQYIPMYLQKGAIFVHIFIFPRRLYRVRMRCHVATVMQSSQQSILGHDYNYVCTSHNFTQLLHRQCDHFLHKFAILPFIILCLNGSILSPIQIQKDTQYRSKPQNRVYRSN